MTKGYGSELKVILLDNFGTGFCGNAILCVK